MATESLPSTEPRGFKTVKLIGSTTLREAQAGAGCFSYSLTPEHRAALGASLEEAAAFARSLRTKADAQATLSRLGVETYGAHTSADLRLRIQLRLIDLWFPEHCPSPGKPQEVSPETRQRLARILGGST